MLFSFVSESSQIHFTTNLGSTKLYRFLAPQTDSSSGSRKASSAGSGYVSERPDDLSPGKSFYCPSCYSSIDLPVEGAMGFLPNYLLKHKILLAISNANNENQACGICMSDKSVSI